MGQKVHPLIQRIGFIKDWNSRWFAKPAEYAKYIEEDYKIRKYIKNSYRQAAISKIIIERLANNIRIKIATARPGIIIGRHGADIERLRSDLNNMTNKEIAVDIQEIARPEAEAQLVAENISLQIQKRIAFRRAIKRAIDQSMSGAVLGIKVVCAGRLGGAEMSRTETFKQGKIPLQTFRADIDYGFAESHTTYGCIGVKVWIYRGDVLLSKGKQEEASATDETVAPKE
jgi:small subunit ribosomal protein S3